MSRKKRNICDIYCSIFINITEKIDVICFSPRKSMIREAIFVLNDDIAGIGIFSFHICGENTSISDSYKPISI